MTAASSDELGYSTFERDIEERLAPGRKVVHGRYLVVKVLGRGGVSIAYAAKDLQSKRAVALKVVTSKYADKPETAARYRNEARLAAAVGHHPNIVHPLEVGRIPEFGQRLYLATELAPGRPLNMLTRSGMEMPRVCRISRDLARALIALHDRGIVHRDVKPSNILVDTSPAGHDTAKLLDFGYAYAVGDGDVAASPDLTMTHERPGTAIYMAPEQAIGLQPTPAFDVYAFGATVYEMLTGNHPYSGCPKVMVIERKCAPDDPPLSVGRIRDGIPPRLAQLTMQCLARDIAERPNIVDILGELNALFEELGLKDSQDPVIGAADNPVAANAIVIASSCTPLEARRRTEVVAVANDDAGTSSAAIRGATAPAEAAEIAAIPAPIKEDRAATSNGTRTAGVIIALLAIGAAGAWAASRGPEAHRAVDSGDDVPISDVTMPAMLAAPAHAPDEPTAPRLDTPTVNDAAANSNNDTAAEDVTDRPAQRDNPPSPETTQPKAPEHVNLPVKKAPSRATVCSSRRNKAVAAKQAKKWTTVVRHTKDESCWKDDASRRSALRVEALLRLGQFKACAREARTSKRPQVLAWLDECTLGLTTGKRPE